MAHILANPASGGAGTTAVPTGMRRCAPVRCARLLLALMLALPLLVSATDTTSIAGVIDRIDSGDFRGADAAIDTALREPALDAQQRVDYAFQRERMRRIRLDFTLTRDEVEARVRKQIPDLSHARFAKWNDAGLFEHMSIDGQELFFKRAPSNLFRLSAEARAQRDPALPPLSDGPMESLNAHQRAIHRAALAEHSSSVLPLRLRMTQTLTVDADAVPDGKTVRAWIPYPLDLPGQQEDIAFVESIPARHEVAPASALQRTVFMEKAANAGQATEFSVTYELTIFGRDFTIEPDKIVASQITPDLAPYVAERVPHVVFTDAMRAFSRKVVGDETNPYRIVQKLFAVVDEIPWAGAREYSTISNIGDYALHAGHADCGQQMLLLITLLRLNGIPARWQSGMVFSDGDYNNIHDWGQVYLAPYGWVPIDVTTGRLHIEEGDDPALEWFYLGGLDNWRIAFNDDWSRPFDQRKQHFRSDDVDSQRGEAEWDGGNLYFDQTGYNFEWQILPVEAKGTRPAHAGAGRKHADP